MTASLGSSRDLNYSVVEGSLATVMTTVTTGVFFTGFALALGAQDGTIGLLASIPALASLAQVPGSLLVGRTGSGKKICLYSVLSHRLVWLGILTVTLTGVSDAIPSLVVAKVLLGIFGAVTSVAWMVWISKLVPETQRGRFFGRRNMVAGAFGMGTSLLAGRFIDRWSSTYPGQVIPVYVGIMGVGVLFGMLSWLVLRFISEPPAVPSPGAASLRSLLRPVSDPLFRRLLLFNLAWNFSVRIGGPFFDVYMIRELAVPFSAIALLGLVGGAMNIAGMRLWGPLCDSLGPRAVLLWGSAGASLTPLLWLFTSPDNHLMLWPINACTGIFWAAIGLASSGLLLRLTPREDGAVYFAAAAVATGVSGAVAPGLGGAISRSMADVTLATPYVTIGGLQILFVITSVMRMGSILLLLRVVAPGEEEPLSVLDAAAFMRFIQVRRLGGIGIETIENLQPALVEGVLASEQRIARLMDRGAETHQRLRRHLDDTDAVVQRRTEHWEDIVDSALKGVQRRLSGLLAWLRDEHEGDDDVHD